MRVLHHAELGVTTQTAKKTNLHCSNSIRAMAVSTLYPYNHLYSTSDRSLAIIQLLDLDLKTREFHPECLEMFAIWSIDGRICVRAEEQDRVARKTVGLKLSAGRKFEVEDDDKLVLSIAFDVTLGKSVDWWHFNSLARLLSPSLIFLG